MSTSRKFGFWTSFFVVIAGVVGTGILTNSGFALRAAGDFGLTMGVWIVCGVMSFFGAWTLATIASSRPHAVGDYDYVREAFGNPVGFMFGLSMFFLGYVCPLALSSSTASALFWPVWEQWVQTEANLNWFKQFDATQTQFAMSMALVVFFSVAHSLSHTSSAGTQNLTTLFKLLVLIMMAAMAWLSSKADWSHVVYNAARATDVSWSTLAGTYVLISYAYTGWNAACYISSEVKHAERNVPLSLLMGSVVVILLYAFLNVGFILAVSAEEIAGMRDDELLRLAKTTLDRLVSPAVAETLSALVSFGILATISAFVLAGSRILAAMSQHGLFISWCGRLSKRNYLPVRAIWVQCVLVLAVFFSGSFSEILEYTTYGLSVLSLLIVAPIFVFKRRGTLNGKVKIPEILAVLFMIVSILVLVSTAIEKPIEALQGCGFVVMCLPLYYLMQGLKKYRSSVKGV